jgi:hypothetical protein
MRTRRALTLCVLLAVSLGGVLAGCAPGGGSTTGTTGAAPTATATATAKPKPKPTAAPNITVQTCQTLMSLAEANQIMHAQTPATVIVASPGDGGKVAGACHYVVAQPETLVNLFFGNYQGPIPIPQQDLVDLVQQLASDPHVTINSAITVNGVGDQAAYLSFSESVQGQQVLGNVFWVLDGTVLFNCYTVNIGSSGNAQVGTQANLQACATQVVSRL